MGDFNSALTLQKLVFDQIQFVRRGFKNKNELQCSIKVQIGMSDDLIYKVTLILNGDKHEEYEILISLSGFFKIEGSDDLSDKVIQSLITKNAVSILMPYLRSELTLLTAQPEMETIVLPPFNINKMLDKK